MTGRVLVSSAICLSLIAPALAQQPPPVAPLQAKPVTVPETSGVTGMTGITAPEPAKHVATRAKGGITATEARLADISTEYQIGPEDVLDISVWKNLELSRTVPVRPDGKISLPLINDIQAAGLTPSELRTQLTTQLGEYVPSPEVAVIIREVHSRKITVVGAVKTPGRFEMKSTATVLEAIAMAQGFGDFAQRDKIVVLRQEGGKTTRLPFNYRKVSEGNEQDNFSVHPGDIIVVP